MNKTRYKLKIAEPDNFDEKAFNANTVWMVKQLRYLGGEPGVVTVKKARNILTMLMDNPTKTVILEGKETGRKAIIDATEHLAGCGIIVEPNGPLAAVEAAAHDAMLLGQYKLSRDLLEVLLKHESKE